MIEVIQPRMNRHGRARPSPSIMRQFMSHADFAPPCVFPYSFSLLRIPPRWRVCSQLVHVPAGFCPRSIRSLRRVPPGDFSLPASPSWFGKHARKAAAHPFPIPAGSAGVGPRIHGVATTSWGGFLGRRFLPAPEPPCHALKSFKGLPPGRRFDWGAEQADEKEFSRT